MAEEALMDDPEGTLAFIEAEAGHWADFDGDFEEFLEDAEHQWEMYNGDHEDDEDHEHHHHAHDDSDIPASESWGEPAAMARKHKLARK